MYYNYTLYQKLYHYIQHTLSPMGKYYYLLFLILAPILAQAASPCSNLCESCLFGSNSPYMCTSCDQTLEINAYILSCQPKIQNNPPYTIIYYVFFAFTIICCIFMFFLVMLGYGVYRQAFENLQLVSIFTWQFNVEFGGQPLIITNWCWITNGMTGTPIILLFITLGLTFIYLIVVLMMTKRLSSDHFSLLIKRKKNVFLFRVFHLTFNGLTFAALVEIQKQIYIRSKDVFLFAMSIIYLFYILVSLITHMVYINMISSLDDPYTKVYVENETSKECLPRNHTIVSLLVRAFNIGFFVFMWSYPFTVLVCCASVQTVYAIYFLLATKYKKKRFFVVNSSSNFLVSVQIIIAGFAAIRYQGNLMSEFRNFQIAWASISFFCLIAVCVILNVEMVVNWMQIKRQLGSVYYKYIICSDVEKDVILNLHDEAFGKSKVETFIPNNLYKQSLQLSQIADAI